MSNKKMFIIGKKNTDSFIVEKEKRIRIDAVDTELTADETIFLLKNFYADATLTYHDVCKKALEQKVAGYKNQDIRKNVYDKEKLVNIKDVISKLISCSLKCLYCDKHVKVLYRMVRDPLQWTLDRIDNDLTHDVSNTVISCLSCNLKRRTTNKDKFIFSQNIKIVKAD
jgi:hypothetical protein